MSVKRLLTILVLALAVSAAAASSASARPIDAVGATPSISGPSVYTGDSSLNSISHEAANGPALVSGPAGDGEGFDWGDAAIGAAATFAVMVIAHGVVVLAGTRRHRRPESAATA
jgi:hypothetical protein